MASLQEPHRKQTALTVHCAQNNSGKYVEGMEPTVC